jgi:hypothetical protein
MLNSLKIIVQLIPIILELVKAIESQIPEGGKRKRETRIHSYHSN